MNRRKFFGTLAAGAGVAQSMAQALMQVTAARTEATAVVPSLRFIDTLGRAHAHRAGAPAKLIARRHVEREARRDHYSGRFRIGDCFVMEISW